MNEKPRILIAASGTGGHILPAVYIADALRQKLSGMEVLFVGSGRPLEEKLIEGNGYNRQVITLTGLKKLGLKGLVQFCLSLPRAIAQTSKLLTSFQPTLVVGVGGYVSVLPIIFARLRGIPTWIHEAEHSAGLANWVLAFFAQGISTAWPDTKIPCAAKVIYTGHPVRPELLHQDFTKLSPSEPPRVLVLGGSQGARSLDKGFEVIASWLADRKVSVWHQCRPEHVDELNQLYVQLGLSARASPFIEAMEEALQWSDVIVSRAGAGAVREIGLSGRPAILVPLPGSQEQTDNAHVLLGKGQAIVLQEGDEFPQQLKTSLEKLLVPEYYQYFNRSGKVSEKSEAAERIAQECILTLTGQRSGLR
jgi:UDP-N-acetylglucosamine--N-acetylmuramyl-(pentapeptide) pyrophosphoryl-undecaprenol N-acetylglucosamine transferase